jgi:hypothetical protein
VGGEEGEQPRESSDFSTIPSAIESLTSDNWKEVLSSIPS